MKYEFSYNDEFVFLCALTRYRQTYYYSLWKLTDIK